jgi:hypothetical protein
MGNNDNISFDNNTENVQNSFQGNNQLFEQNTDNYQHDCMQEHSRKSLSSRSLIGVGCAVVLGLVGIAIWQFIAYSTANEAFEAYDFQTAIANYQNVFLFLDASDKAEQAKVELEKELEYQAAIFADGDMDYNKAFNTFEKLADYRDSTIKKISISEKRYNQQKLAEKAFLQISSDNGECEFDCEIISSYYMSNGLFGGSTLIVGAMNVHTPFQKSEGTDRYTYQTIWSHTQLLYGLTIALVDNNLKIRDRVNLLAYREESATSLSNIRIGIDKNNSLILTYRDSTQIARDGYPRANVYPFCDFGFFVPCVTTVYAIGEGGIKPLTSLPSNQEIFTWKLEDNEFIFYTADMRDMPRLCYSIKDDECYFNGQNVEFNKYRISENTFVSDGTLAISVEERKANEFVQDPYITEFTFRNYEPRWESGYCTNCSISLFRSP